VAEADDVDGGRRHQFERRLRLDQPGQVSGLGDVLVDQPAELSDAMFLQRHPDFERAEAA